MPSRVARREWWIALPIVLASLGACTSSGGRNETEEQSPPPLATQALQVAGGNYNACVRLDDGTVSCWGRCTMGCGIRSQETSTGPRTIVGVRDAIDIAVGDSFACAATADGHVQCWGSNFYGAVGTPGIDWAAGGLQVGGITDAVEVEASQTMSCARTRHGDVYVWGGVADASPPPPESTRRPRLVPAMQGATALSSDPWGCCAALGNDGFACIRDGEAEATRGSARTGACGCRLDAAGILRCEMYELPGPPMADGTQPQTPRLPCAIESLDAVRDFTITDAAGYAIRHDGELWRWGGGDRFGTPAPLSRMDVLPKVRSIASGNGATYAIDDAGVLWGWGWSREHSIVELDGFIEKPERIWPAR